MNALLLAGLLCLAAPLRPVPVILDTDIGSDIDDTWALCMLLGSPEVDLKLVVTAFRNTPDKTRLVAKVLERCGRTDIPIGTGVKTEDGKLNQDTWIKDYTLEGYPGTVYVDGVQALIDAVHQAKDTITICVIGPQGNLASALKRDPSIAQKARIVSMAGSVHIGYNGKEGRQPEWNVRADVASARAVFAAPWAITIAPLDTCGTLILGGAGYARVAASDAPRAKTVMENYSIWTPRRYEQRALRHRGRLPRLRGGVPRDGDDQAVHR